MNDSKTNISASLYSLAKWFSSFNIYFYDADILQDFVTNHHTQGHLHARRDGY